MSTEKLFLQAMNEWLVYLADHSCIKSTTLKNYGDIIGKWYKILSRHHNGGELYLSNLNTRFILDVFEKELKPTKKLGSIFQYFKILNSFFKFCVHKGYMNTPILDFVKIPCDDMPIERKEKRKRQIISDEEFQKCINLCNQYINIFFNRIIKNKQQIDEGTLRMSFETRFAYPAVRFWYYYKFIRFALYAARYQGLRINDIANLEWNSFDLKNDILIIWTRKRFKRIRIPLSPIVKQELMKIPKTDNVYLFGYLANNYARITRIIDYANKLIQKALQTHKTFHDLRATFIYSLYKAGVDVIHISRIVAHSDISTTLTYIEDELEKETLRIKDVLNENSLHI